MKCMNIFVAVCLLAVLGNVSGRVESTKKETYEGYKIVRIIFESPDDTLKILNHVQEQTNQIEEWECTPGISDHMDVIVGPKAFTLLRTALEAARADWQVRNHNLARLVESSDFENKLENERVKHRRRRRRDVVQNDILGTYASLSEYVDWMQQLENDYPDMVEVKVFGITSGGNNLYAMKVGTKSPCAKPGILMDSLTHAREWIAPATLVYLVHQLMNGYHTGDPDSVNLLTNIDWYFVPIVNPDGYEYSKSTARLWRKNRSNPTSRCAGVDLNRNWGYSWDRSDEEVARQTSTNPCSLLYRGPEAASELEVKFYSSYIRGIRPRLNAYLALHNFHQSILTRWGYTKERHAEHDTLIDLARNATEAMKSGGGETYIYGPAPDILYAYSGGAPDWLAGELNLSLSFTIELRDRGYFGFLLPSNFTEPVGSETWSALKVIAQHVLDEAGTDQTSCMPSGGETDPQGFTRSVDSGRDNLTPQRPPSTTLSTTTQKTNPRTTETSASPRQSNGNNPTKPVSVVDGPSSEMAPNVGPVIKIDGEGENVASNMQDPQEDRDLSKFPDLTRSLKGGQGGVHNKSLSLCLLTTLVLVVLSKH